jgi:diketogulonate reductase-like aldo/keto reductase
VCSACHADASAPPPQVALGVWLAKPNEVGDAVKAALKAGYRHIDGAWAYRNEAEVGAGLAASGVPRRDVWLTSKLWNAFHAPDAVERALDETLGNLGVDYLDMYLMHWPIAYRGTETDSNGKPVIDDALTANPLPTWRKMEEMVAKGKVRNIGVSKSVPRLPPRAGPR